MVASNFSSVHEVLFCFDVNAEFFLKLFSALDQFSLLDEPREFIIGLSDYKRS
jgi:hypothetical protein